MIDEPTGHRHRQSGTFSVGTSGTFSVGSYSRPPQRIAVDVATRLFLADLPLLRDVDDTAGAGSRLYYLMAGFGGPGWPGAALYRSTDGSA